MGDEITQILLTFRSIRCTIKMWRPPRRPPHQETASISQWGQNPKASEPSGATDGSLLFIGPDKCKYRKHKARDAAKASNIRQSDYVPAPPSGKNFPQGLYTRLLSALAGNRQPSFLPSLSRNDSGFPQTNHNKFQQDLQALFCGEIFCCMGSFKQSEDLLTPEVPVMLPASAKRWLFQ